MNVSSAYIDNDIRFRQTAATSRRPHVGKTGSANPALYAATGGYGILAHGRRAGRSDVAPEHALHQQRHRDLAGEALADRAQPTLDWTTWRTPTSKTYSAARAARSCATVTGSPERQGKRLYNDGRSPVQRRRERDGDLRATTASVQDVDRSAFNFDRLFGVMAEADILPHGALTLSAGAQKTLTEQTAETKTIGEYLEQRSAGHRRFSRAIRVDAKQRVRATTRAPKSYRRFRRRGSRSRADVDG